MAMNQSNFDRLERAVTRRLHDHWVLFLVEGIVLVVIGLAAVAVPPLATLAVAIFLGWLFLISGIVGLVTTFWMRHAPGFWWSLLSAVLALAVGVVLVAAPLSGALSLALVIIVFFVIEGVASIMYALEHKRALTGRWGWMLVSGIVDLVLAVVLALGFPGAALWLIGLLVGINLVFGGVTLIVMALHARSAGAVP
ncbi:MAG TPA: HdeD family acid-resistance protein [Candidatus Sulfotelmatobacter sp.]|nr:HdeD family acid-resistance protein [Candidatus Sulfotelmatobacter sp.]